MRYTVYWLFGDYGTLYTGLWIFCCRWFNRFGNYLIIKIKTIFKLDGYIARKYPTQKSMLGSILDPVADKFLISTLFVTLTYTSLIPGKI